MASVCQLPLYTVDAFTDRPFTGNPAAVVLDDTDGGLSEDVMQKIAAEMNISETAFIRTLEKGDCFDTAGRFGLRWFTPKTEVPLCGHATLASAATLFMCRSNTSSSITFKSASGPLITCKKGSALFSLDFPLNCPEVVQDNEKYQPLAQAVCGGNDVMEVAFCPTTRKLLVRLADNVSRKELEALQPNTDTLPSLEPSGAVKGVIVTVKADGTDRRADGENYDFLSRYFAPWVGIPEDPVTGSAHTVLAGYWEPKLSRKSFLAHCPFQTEAETQRQHTRQCSSRGGDLWLHVEDNGRVTIAGNATVLIQGHISIPN